MQTILAKQVDEQVLAAVARAHRQGRRLFIGTTNMEAGKLVIWDMGAIATSGTPGALELFRKVMLATASIPVAFPPVYFPVVADDKRYEEMHVDGAQPPRSSLTALPWICTPRIWTLGSRGGRLFDCIVVRNGKLTVSWKLMLPAFCRLPNARLHDLLSAQVVGDLYRIYTIVSGRGSSSTWHISLKTITSMRRNPSIARP